MRNAGLEEAQAGIKLPGEISVTSDMQMTPPLWQKSEEELKSLLMKVKEESEKVGSTFRKQRSWHLVPSVQFGSVTQSCPTLCDPMNPSMPGLPVHHQLPEST